ncbi:MAG TPA: phosphonoacetate hydrolase [Candidatus Baltobacteraceae bacterium]|jgi:phosphonoacetate hydrolase|nr:phosphonoacetate hydrolase [Candidatus Baltobacteraceae bacterium]
MTEFSANGRAYRLSPVPIVVICLDGSADEYLDAAMARGRMPNLQRLSVQGYRGLARGAMPSLTNVNNTSIVTGAPPRIHGIGGNYFFDTTCAQEVMMNSAAFLRVETIFPAAQRAGRRVAVVTAKEKLRDIFASGLIDLGGIALSSEKAREAARATHGIDAVESLVGPTPPIYSGEASLYVLKTGVKLIEHEMADFLYLSTTDFIQHKFGPDSPEAVEFYAGIDEELGQLLALGALVGLTADHGMNAKQKADGSPNVIYLESHLAQQFGPGFRVILPITDPYVAHHGALGSFAQIHLPPANGLAIGAVIAFLEQLPGVAEVLERASAARRMELPEDRMGDLVVCSTRDVVLGRTPQWHDLTALKNGLRSHGGRYEEMVPFVLSAPLNAEYAARARGDVRNFDIFDFTCNGTLP